MASTPKVHAHRIDDARWVGSSFNGAGAAYEGGRWNSAGVRVVYGSQHLAMAASEKYVHLPKPIPPKLEFVAYRINFGHVRIKHVRLEDLPADWQTMPVPVSTQKLGDAWVASGETAVMAVPSVLIPDELNFVLNPAHPDFKKIQISSPVPFLFDPRLASLKT